MEVNFEMLDGEAIIFDHLNHCIIGCDQRGYAVYSYKKMHAHFMQDMTYEDAEEWIDFNVVGVKPDNYTILYDKNEI